MLVKSWSAVSFGRRYVLASLIYLGLGIVLLSTVVPLPQIVLAQQSGCEQGEKECGGDCIPESWLCCEDGTYGDPSACVCCQYCEEEDPDAGECLYYTDGIVCEE